VGDVGESVEYVYHGWRSILVAGTKSVKLKSAAARLNY